MASFILLLLHLLPISLSLILLRLIDIVCLLSYFRCFVLAHSICLIVGQRFGFGESVWLYNCAWQYMRLVWGEQRISLMTGWFPSAFPFLSLQSNAASSIRFYVQKCLSKTLPENYCALFMLSLVHVASDIKQFWTLWVNGINLISCSGSFSGANLYFVCLHSFEWAIEYVLRNNFRTHTNAPKPFQ